MKKKDKPSISIIIPKEKHAVGVPSSFYSFFTLFTFALGIYSSLLLMISSAALNYKIILILGLFSFFLTILQKIKKLPVRFLASVLPYVFTLYLYRKRFFTQASDTFSGGIFKCLCNNCKKNRFEFPFSCSHLSFFTPAFAVAAI